MARKVSGECTYSVVVVVRMLVHDSCMSLSLAQSWQLAPQSSAHTIPLQAGGGRGDSDVIMIRNQRSLTQGVSRWHATRDNQQKDEQQHTRDTRLGPSSAVTCRWLHVLLCD